MTGAKGSYNTVCMSLYYFAANTAKIHTETKIEKCRTCLASLLSKGPVTLCNFLSNLSRNAVARQVAEELNSVTWLVLQFFLHEALHEALHEVELSSTFRNGLQQLATPLHSVSPLQQLVSQFYGSFNKGACAHFLLFFPSSIARQVAEKITQCNRASIPILGNLQRYIFNYCETCWWENCAV